VGVVARHCICNREEPCLQGWVVGLSHSARILSGSFLPLRSATRVIGRIGDLIV